MQTILLVEDEKVIALKQEHILQENGYAVRHASKGEEALDLLREDSYDLVLMDIDLGEGINGDEAARRIVEMYDLPIVFLSSHAELEVVTRTENITSYGYVVKGSGEAILLTSIRMALRLYKANRDLREKNREVETINEKLEQTVRKLEKSNKKNASVTDELGDSQDILFAQEEALRDKERHYRLVFENVPVGILYFDIQGEITNCNEEFVRIIGSSKEVLLGLDMRQLPDAKIRDALKNALNGQKGTYEGYYRSVTADKITPVRGWFSPMLDEEGRLEGGIGLFEDISEEEEARKKQDEAWEALKKREALYRALIELAPDAFLLGTPEGYILEANANAVKLTGYDSRELVGMYIARLFSEEEQKKHPFRFDLLKQGRIVRTERCLTRKDGAVVPIDMKTRMMPDGTYQTFFRDNSEQQQILQALRHNESRLRSIVENSTNMFYRQNPDHLLTYVSPRSKELLGYKPEELVVYWPALATDNPVNKEALAKTETAIKTGERQEPCEMELQHKNGSAVLVEIRETPIVENGKTVAIVGGLRDITETRKREEELREAVAAREAMFSELQHRVKNSITMILSMISLEMNHYDNQEVQEAFRKLRERINTALEIFKMLGETGEDIQYLNLGRYLKAVAQSVMEAYAPRKKHISLHLDVEDMTIRAREASSVGLIVNELLTNALKYAFPGNKTGTITVRLWHENGTVTLEVIDNGIGFSPDLSGGGLGQQLVQMLVEQVDGTLRVSDSEGTKNHIHIPALSLGMAKNKKKLAK